MFFSPKIYDKTIIGFAFCFFPLEMCNKTIIRFGFCDMEIINVSVNNCLLYIDEKLHATRNIAILKRSAQHQIWGISVIFKIVIPFLRKT